MSPEPPFEPWQMVGLVAETEGGAGFRIDSYTPTLGGGTAFWGASDLNGIETSEIVALYTAEPNPTARRCVWRRP